MQEGVPQINQSFFSKKKLFTEKETLDMRVTSPTCDSHVLDVQRPLGAAKKAEKEKEAKYGPEVQAWAGNMTFSPFVIEAYGAFGDCAQAVCRFAGVAAEELDGWGCGEAVALCCSCSCCPP